MNFAIYQGAKFSLMYAKICYCLEIHPICVARGKNILTPVVRTNLYVLPKFHGIIFQYSKTTAK